MMRRIESCGTGLGHAAAAWAWMIWLLALAAQPAAQRSLSACLAATHPTTSGQPRNLLTMVLTSRCCGFLSLLACCGMAEGGAVDKVRSFYQTHNPDYGDSKLEALLLKNKGREYALLRALNQELAELEKIGVAWRYKWLRGTVWAWRQRTSGGESLEIYGRETTALTFRRDGRFALGDPRCVGAENTRCTWTATAKGVHVVIKGGHGPNGEVEPEERFTLTPQAVSGGEFTGSLDLNDRRIKTGKIILAARSILPSLPVTTPATTATAMYRRKADGGSAVRVVTPRTWDKVSANTALCNNRSIGCSGRRLTRRAIGRADHHACLGWRAPRHAGDVHRPRVRPVRA